MATVSLQMIVKDEVEKVKALVEEARPYFDEINITVTQAGKATTDFQNALFKRNGSNEKVNINYFNWVDDFSEARNFNLKTCKADYFFWLDADDKFDFSEIPNLVKHAEEGSFEAIYLPYDYARDESGRTVAVHWRERLVKRSAGFTWRGALHETLIVDHQFPATRLQKPAIVHDSPDIGASIERNHKILLKEAEKDPVDPRILHYLGLSYFTIGDYKSCIKVLEKYITVGGWDEEIYRSLMKMSEAAGLLDDDESARNYALQAAGVLPNYPNAYYALAQLEFASEQWKECLEWLRVAFDKPLPTTMSVVDPTMVERGKVVGACSEFQLGNYRDAVELLKKADDPAVEKLMPNFEFEASKQRFTDIAPALTKHVDKNKLYEGLAEDLKYDPRMKWLREEVIAPQHWPDKSIVWFVGQGYEEWGPHTLDKGMGGSEEAVIYLSREFAKLGYKVTVYGPVNEEIYDCWNAATNPKYGQRWFSTSQQTGVEGPVLNPTSTDERGGYLNNPIRVHYKPWRTFDTRDQFDTLIVWRAPHGVDKLKAKVKILDIHDKLEAKDMRPYDDVTYFFKSQYHRDLYPHIKKAKVIGNGIKKEQFS